MRQKVSYKFFLNTGDIMSLVVTVCYVCLVLYRFIFEFAKHQSIQVCRSYIQVCRNLYILL